MASEETYVRMMCPNLACRKVLSVPAEARGKTVKCKACGSSIRVPSVTNGPKSTPGGAPR
ncbi:MAG: hypothetical protein AB7Q00_11005 [Phycisphaerales bacterium]|nr:MAG: hypothetical protein IPK69_00840 [Phycisphaerales bacterium]